MSNSLHKSAGPISHFVCPTRWTKPKLKLLGVIEVQMFLRCPRRCHYIPKYYVVGISMSFNLPAVALSSTPRLIQSRSRRFFAALAFVLF